MAAYPRSEMEEMMRRWLKANEDAEAAGDWRGLADYYTEDAEYGWNLGPNEEFMARGREQIREWVMVSEMEGLEGWEYPYDAVLIDEQRGEIVAFWRQVAPAQRPDGKPYEIKGLGGSWFRYAGNYCWSWQRDFFDFGNAMNCFMEMIQAGKLGDGMQKRIERIMGGEVPPGHLKIG